MSGKNFCASCECGNFSVELLGYPDHSPGRLLCYCDDCQSYLHHIQRSDLLDQNGGTEIIPFYPSEIKILKGVEHLQCVRLAGHGMFRFYTSCCRTPVANTDPKRAWAGFHRRMIVGKNASQIDQTLGPVRASILGKYGKGVLPKGTPQKMNLKGVMAVLPFILKGIFGKKSRPSAFFSEQTGEAIVATHILTAEERRGALRKAGFDL